MAKASKTEKFNPLTYGFPECREQHYWKFYDGAIDEKVKLAYQTEKCPKCGTKRFTIISMRQNTYGLLHKPRTYVHPDGYLIEGGLDRAGKGQLRIATFLKKLEGAK